MVQWSNLQIGYWIHIILIQNNVDPYYLGYLTCEYSWITMNTTMWNMGCTSMRSSCKTSWSLGLGHFVGTAISFVCAVLPLTGAFDCNPLGERPLLPWYNFPPVLSHFLRRLSILRFPEICWKGEVLAGSVVDCSGHLLGAIKRYPIPSTWQHGIGGPVYSPKHWSF